MPSEREQFDTFSVAAPLGRSSRVTDALDSFGVERTHFRDPERDLQPDLTWRPDRLVLPNTGGVPLLDVDRRRREAEAEPAQGFDVSRLPAGVGWSQRYDPTQGRPMVSATIPAAKRRKDGTLKTEGTTGIEGVSILVGRWGTEPVEYGTVQVSSKALHEGSNVLPMQGDIDLACALDLAGDLLRRLGYRGSIDDALVPRFDSVIDFTNVSAHGRYVAAFGDNKSPVRGGRHVMHADETLALHFNHGMSRLYDKHRESPLDPLGVGRTRYELERKRARLVKAGMDNVRSLDLRRLDREAREMFEQSGYDRDVAPLSEWAYKVLSCVPVDEDGAPLPGYSAATKRGAMMHALLVRMGIDPHTNKNTITKYRRLYEYAGVEMDDVSLVDPDGPTVFLDLVTQEERERPRKAG